MTLKLLAAGKEASYFQPIKDAFDQEDAVVITATSIALALFLARKNQPNLIISQLQLVDGDGLALFHETRNELEIARMPFAFLLTEKEKKTDIFKEISQDTLASKQNILLLPNHLKETPDIAAWKKKILTMIE